MIDRDMLARNFLRAGLRPGSRVIVHSSLRSIGKVKGGAMSVIAALQATVGPMGTIVMPTFTFSMIPWSKEPYIQDTSPSRVGLITETFRKVRGVLRSNHPSHSFAVWGDQAQVVAQSHIDAVGKRSPLGWLLENGGQIVQIGTGQMTSTSLHLCEELAEVPYLDVTFTEGQSHERAHRVCADGTVELVRVEPVPGCSQGFQRAEPCLNASGVVNRVMIGEAETLITSLPALAGVMGPVLRRHAGLLLCTRPDCSICQRRRRVVHSNPALAQTDLIDLFVEGFPGGQHLNWQEREVVESEAIAQSQALSDELKSRGVSDWSTLKRWLQGEGIEITQLDDDPMAFSQWDPDERKIRIWRGAVERLCGALRMNQAACAEPLKRVDDETLESLAVVHEALHAMRPPRKESTQRRLIEEVAGRLVADQLLQLPFPSLLIDVWMMHWAGEIPTVPPNQPEVH